MKTKHAKDIAQPETYATAKRLFARHARLFDVIDNSHESCYRNGVWSDRLFREQAHRFIEKIRHAKKDFWIYETDMSNTRTTVSRMAITYTEQRGPATDIQSASPAKMRYINKRAKKAGLAIADYVDDRRPLLHKQVDGRHTPINFSIHSLKRFWERNESGVGACAFDDVSIDHISPAFCQHQTKGPNADMLLRTDLLVPYHGGAFMGTPIFKPRIGTYRFVNDGPLEKIDNAPRHINDFEYVPGFNAITYIGESTMSSFQKLMCDAIKQGDYVRFGKLYEQDFKKTAVEHDNPKVALAKALANMDRQNH